MNQQLRRLFDLWLDPSEDLRQYLWGHRSEQIEVARQLIDILPFGSILEMLRYLVEDYWAPIRMARLADIQREGVLLRRNQV